MRSTEVIEAEEAAQRIADGATVAIQGSGGGVNEPSLIIKAIGDRFRSAARPRDLTLVHATGLGDRKTLGTDYLAEPGLVRRDIAGHLGMAPSFARLLYEDKVQGYNFPQGVISQLFAAIGGRKPGVFTKIGLGTFVDPRQAGGRVNASARDDLVELVQLRGEEWLFFPSFPIDVAIVRGTVADTNGNVSMEHEAAILEGINIAQAARSSGGIVIAQVKYLVKAGGIDPRRVRIPGIYVDYVVVDPDQKQTTLDEYNPGFSGEWPTPLERLEPLPVDEKKIIALRAHEELFEGAVVNLGVGVPSYIAAVASEKGTLDKITFTVEQGIIGGRPAGGVIFGVAYNPEAIISEADQFAFYDGGGLDVAFLGMAQLGSNGDVNVSKVGSMLTGCGGFINISQSAKKVVFCGTFTTKGFDACVDNGRLTINNDGRIRKLVSKVDQITFSGDYALRGGQEVLYVTERAVFELRDKGVTLTEIAPGVDVQRDILDRMDFRPRIAKNLRTINPDYYRAVPTGVSV